MVIWVGTKSMVIWVGTKCSLLGRQRCPYFFRNIYRAGSLVLNKHVIRYNMVYGQVLRIITWQCPIKGGLTTRQWGRDEQFCRVECRKPSTIQSTNSGKIDIPTTRVHNWAPILLDTVILINGCGVKLVSLCFMSQ